MRYVLCEDEGAGKRFFEKLARICGTKDYVITSSHGNVNFKTKMKELLQKIQSGDKLLLAFDNIGMTKNFNPKEIISIAVNICDRKNVELWYTRYYCFEEVFLSYTEFFRMYKELENDTTIYHKLLPSLEYVGDAIMKQKEYYDRMRDEVQAVIEIAPRADINKEKFCDALLENTSRLLNGRFKYTKSEFGSCWLDSCKTLGFKNKDFICKNQCSYSMKESSDKEKLMDLEEKSLCALDKGFSLFFN